ncbi:protein of unknown function DUF928 [Leptolyngbya sp. PCC 7375]|nr:protein of unknown function DUF928 [Leptolyngbya sp. PCC 7375]
MKLTNNTITSVSLPASKWLVRLTAIGVATLLGIQCCSPSVVQASEEEEVRQGLPGRRISGASRLPTSACAQNTAPLVAIVPETNLGATALAEPTLWLSVPEVTSAKQLEFYLFNAQDEIIYQTRLTVEPTADLVGLDLGVMGGAPKLEINQRYRWAASIVCNPNNRSENISVEGWVDRVEGSSLDSNKLWYDHLGVLLEQMQRHPHNQDIWSQWHTLMASARLEQIVPLSVSASSVEITLPTTEAIN